MYEINTIVNEIDNGEALKGREEEKNYQFVKSTNANLQISIHIYSLFQFIIQENCISANKDGLDIASANERQRKVEKKSYASACFQFTTLLDISSNQ